MVLVSPRLSTVILNVNGLIYQSEDREQLNELIIMKDSSMSCLQETNRRFKDICKIKVKSWFLFKKKQNTYLKTC